MAHFEVRGKGPPIECNARFKHIWDQHMYAPELYCLKFSAEPASGLGQSSTLASGQNSEAINIRMHVVFLHAHGVGTVHTACLTLLDHSSQTDDANLISRIANGPDRNYPRWWQRMEMHAWHVHISVELLVSVLHFIVWTKGGLYIQCVSAHFVHDWTQQRYAVQF